MADFSSPLAVGGFIAVLLVTRTVLGDRTLLAEPDGYSENARQVRSWLLPDI